MWHRELRFPWHDSPQPRLETSDLITSYAGGVARQFLLYRFKLCIHQFSCPFVCSERLIFSSKKPSNTFAELLMLQSSTLKWYWRNCLESWSKLMVGLESPCTIPVFFSFSLLEDSMSCPGNLLIILEISKSMLDLNWFLNVAKKSQIL